MRNYRICCGYKNKNENKTLRKNLPTDHPRNNIK